MSNKVIDGVRSVIQALYDEHGEVKTSMLVEAAKPKDSPAHAAFEWDNRKAGGAYRLYQARMYLRRVKIIHEGKDAQLYHVPVARVTVTEETEDLVQGREGMYKPAGQLIHHVDEYQAAIGEIQGKIASLRRSLSHLMDVAQSQPQGDDRAAIIVQLARALDMMEDVLTTRH